MRYLALAYRFVRCLAIAAAAILILIICAIQVQQWVFHHRAVRLLRDIQSITLRQTTFREAQVLFNRWKNFGKYDGICTEKYCEFRISMETFLETREFNFFGREWLEDDYVRLGARPARIFSGITVINGIVWSKSFDLEVGVPYIYPDGQYVSLNLIGHANSVSRFTLRPDYASHPDYIIWSPGGCTGCVELIVQYTPYADPRLVQRLMDINLSCLLPRSACREREDLMPGAWNQRNQDHSAHPQSWDNPDCNEQTLGYLARDAQSAAIVEVLANRIEKGDEKKSIQFSTLRLLNPLKRIIGWDVGVSHDFRIFDSTVALTRTNKPSEVRPGTRFILLLTGTGVEEPCEAVPLTPHNLDLVSRGITLDYLAPYPDLDIQNIIW